MKYIANAKKIKMTNKEIALNQFREYVFREYKKCQNNYFEMLKIVAEVVRVSQDLEFELKQLLQKELKTEINLEKKMAKELIDLLNLNGFFKALSEQEKDDLIKRLKTVINCRNWVIHAGVKEYEGIKNYVDSGIFLHIVETIELFKANTSSFFFLWTNLLKLAVMKSLRIILKMIGKMLTILILIVKSIGLMIQ